MKVWILHNVLKCENEGLLEYTTIEVFSNIASAEKYFDEEIKREAQWWHDNVSLDFDEDVFAEDGNYDEDNDERLIQWGNDYEWKPVYRVRRKPHYFLVSNDITGYKTEITLTEKEMNN